MKWKFAVADVRLDKSGEPYMNVEDGDQLQFFKTEREAIDYMERRRQFAGKDSFSIILETMIAYRSRVAVEQADF